MILIVETLLHLKLFGYGVLPDYSRASSELIGRATIECVKMRKLRAEYLGSSQEYHNPIKAGGGNIAI